MKTTQVSYEWDCETVQVGGEGEEDVLNHNHGDLLYVLRAAAETPEPGTRFDVVLVRDVSDVIDGEFDGLVDRQWAYLEDGKLPEHFDGGIRVPKQFHWELQKAQAVLAKEKAAVR